MEKWVSVSRNLLYLGIIPMVFFLLAAAVTRQVQRVKAGGDLEKHNQSLKDARTADYEGDRARALESLKKASHHVPNDVNAHYRLATAFKRYGQNQDFLHHLEQSLRLRPEQRVMEFAALALSYMNEGDYEKARSILEHDIHKKWPDSPEAHYIEGRLAMHEGATSAELRMAVASMERCLTTQSDHPSARLQLAVCLKGLGELERAETELRVFLASAPDSIKAVHLLGEILRQKGEIDEAAIYLNKHKQLDERRQRLRFLQTQYSLRQYTHEDLFELGSLYADMNKLHEAQNTLSVYVKLEPKDPAGHQKLAEVYQKLGNTLEAEFESELAEGLSGAANKL